MALTPIQQRRHSYHELEGAGIVGVVLENLKRCHHNLDSVFTNSDYPGHDVASLPGVWLAIVGETIRQTRGSLSVKRSVAEVICMAIKCMVNPKIVRESYVFFQSSKAWFKSE